jgi:phosphoribosylformimino-5-aminoimidazole carboxamide ribotide isomerase
MEIIPVLDLMQGLVVRGVKGERDRYRPVKSILSATADPLEVARALQQETACRTLYIADLDAIQGTGNNISAIKEIASQLDVDLWVDAGTATVAPIEQLLGAGAATVIIGSETLETLQQLRIIFDSVAGEKILFSLDITKGLVWSRTKELTGMQPLEALSILTEEGIDRFILLTLDVVGTAAGPDLPLLQKTRHHFPSATIIAGGGVKAPSHLNALASLGVDGVLVATSLHKGWISKQDLLLFGQ